MRELPRQLTVDELAELFEGRTRFVERLAAVADPLGQAGRIARELSGEEKKEVLDAHPAIGRRTGLSARSAAEQGSEDDPAVLAELERLNREYEARFGFRFVVFVNRRPKSEILPVLRERIGRTREEELETALDELVSIARDPLAPRLMLLASYATDWLDLGIRWLHVIAAIAWIGSSFYFIALDNHLTVPARKADSDEGVGGEAWEIHGGGFYHVLKYRVAPPRLPERLLWFKWEAYTTWLSGFALFVVLFYVYPRAYLIDRSVADLSPAEAIGISIALLAGSWIAYDLLCRALERHEIVLAVGVAGLIVLAAWASWQLFAPRAAFVQTGAMVGTMMAGNVLFVIIPAHWELVRAKEAGREPDPAPGIRAKDRSVHNNYLTLPVVLAMLSTHFPFVYGHANGWLALCALMAVGAWIRHFFNLRHKGTNAWWIPLSAAAAIAGIAVWLAPPDSKASAAPASAAQVAAGKAVFQTAGCAGCHTLKDAGSAGTVGPDLDAAKPSRDLVVERVTGGQGAMPPFHGTLTDAQIQAVAAYVSTVAGR